MANQPTIVVANLDDAKLKASIDKMVNDLNAGLNKMTKKTDAAVAKMQKSLQSVGNIKFDYSGSDGGSSKRTKKQHEETEAVKQTAKAYDKLAQSQQKSTQVKSARESYYAFVQGYKEQAKAMGELIKTEESRLSGTPLAKFSQETKKQLSQLDVSIDQTKWKINALYQEEKRLQQEALRQKVGSADFERAWLKKDDYKTARVREGERLIELEKERQRIIASDPSVQKLDRDIEQSRAKIQQLIADEKRLQSESLKQTVGSAEFEKMRNQKYTVRDERIKEQERLVQLERERQNLVSVDPIRTQLANLDGMRAEHERLLNIMKDENVTSLQQVSAERKVTEELNKQMQKIFEIDSRKKASAAFQSISGMDSSTLERAEAKLKVLEALKKKVHDTDLFSAKNMQNLEAMISYQKSIVEKHKNAGLGVTKDDEEAIKKAAAAEEQWTEKIKARGQVAQETSRKMLRMLNEEAQAGGKGLMGMYTIDGKKISAVKELSVAIKDMQNAYNKMSDSEKESAVGRALKRDIENAKEAIRYVSAYNALASGLNRGGVGNQQQQLNMERLRQIIKQLTEDFSKLSIEDVKAGRGNLLIDRIQRTSRALQQLQAQMNRPTSLDKALKLPANTLDEIAYKMQMLSNYRAHLNMFDPKQKEEIDAVNKAIEKLRLEQNKIMGQNKEMLASNNALVRSFNYMKNRLAFYFTVGASTQFIKSLIDIRSQYEMNERALGILINSAERGTQIFKELSEMALVSPYTLIELSSAAKQLVAYDIAAKDVVDTTRRLADMASAVGVPMERLTYALGQIKAYGYLNNRDARMFANAGIPLVKQLADYYTQLEGRIISVGDVYDRMKKKAIDYNDVMAVVTKMTDEGGKFFDFQAKMADSLKVRLANLTLAWNNMLNEIGADSQGILSATIGGLKELFLHWKDINQIIWTIITAFGAWKAAQLAVLAATGHLTGAMTMQVLVGEKLQAKMASLAAGAKGLSIGLSSVGMAFWLTVGNAIMTYRRNVEEIERLNKTIQDGAAEASEALDKLLHSSEMVSAKLAAVNNKLSVNEASKTWEVLREQIEMSAASSKAIIAELIQEEDLNIRVSKAFTLAESIQEAKSKLSDLNNALDITQDSILFGLFGEGLVEDIEDYNERLRISAQTEELYFKSTGSVITDVVQGLTGFFNDMKEILGSSEEEAEREIRNFAHNAAETIKDELGEESLKDKVQVNEAVASVIGGIEQMFPQIRGKGKALFEEFYYDTMSKEFSGAVDKQAFYYDKFLERLKKDHASAFGDVTDDILKGIHTWSPAQIDAIQKTADKLKRDLPEASQNAIDGILYQLNSTEFKLRIVAEFSTNSVDEINKQFRNKFIKPQKDALGEQLGEAEESYITRMRALTPWGDNSYGNSQSKEELENLQKYRTLMRKTGEDDLAYEKRIRDERQKKLDLAQAEKDIIANKLGKEDAGSKAILKNAQETLKATEDWLNTAKEVESWGGYDFSTKKENTAANKAQHEAETELQKALKEELQLIEQIRSNYKSLTKEGASHTEAIATAIDGYDETVGHINKVLGKYGIGKLDLSKFAGIQNPRELVNMLEDQVNKLLKSSTAKPEEIKELQVKVQKLKVEAKTYDLSMITKGLNNELGKLKDEYELAVELDANPELGSVFADMMGLNIETLPRTIEEYAKKYTERLNKYLRDTKSGIELPSLNLTNDDLRAFEEMVEQEKLSQAVYENIKKGVLAVRDLKKKDISETTKEWNSLIDKYGKLEAKILKITKDTSKERLNVINKFGTDEQKKNARNLVNMLSISEDPSEVSRLQTELTNLLKDVVAKNPKAVDVSGTIANEQSSLTSKAYWEDFKNSDLYTMTFEDMSRNSTKAIQLIIDKLEQLKDKVKEDPASMKALSKSLQDARKELENRSSTTTLVEASKEMKAATEEVTSAKKRLAEANREVSDAEQELGSSTEGTKAYANAVERLRVARERQEEAEIEYAKSANKVKAAQKKMQVGLETLSNELDNVQNLFKVVADLFADAGDDDTAEAINAISQGFAVMTTVIMGVVAAMVLLETTQPYLLAIAAALSVVVGLVSFLSGNSNKKITEQVEKSERAVKRLEIAYKDLEDAATHAYGAITMGVNRVTLANKELQLVELKRQIQLEKSRDSKYRDQDKILELEGQYKDLVLEIKNGVEDIVTEMLGISSAGDAATQLVEAMIDAFREGEDAMKAFSDKWDEMIDNMILKLIISQYMQKAWDNVMKTLNDKEEEFLAKSSSDKAEAQYLLEKYSSSFGEWLVDNGLGGYLFANAETKKTIEKAYQDYLNSLRDRIAIADKTNEQASEDYLKWSLDYMMGEGRDYMEGVAENLIEGLGEWYKFGDKGETSLSALQAGIQGITEDTAGALEAITNGMYQQVTLQSDILQQINATLQNFDLDIQTATLGQILLQLQASYQVQQSIQMILEGVLVPSGRAFAVELIS